jgi:Zn-dependent protease
MRDPMSWALQVFRAFGIPVKVHLFFFIFTIGMFLRQVGDKNNPIWWVDVLFFTVFLLFGIILLHEFGHCFGGRYVGGDAKEILIWPLGGLAYVEVPHTPRANFITTAAGPGVNVIICFACAIGLAFGGFLPNANPLANPYVSEMKNFQDGRVHTSVYGLRLYKQGTAEQMPGLQEAIDKANREAGFRERTAFRPQDAEAMASLAALGGYERALAPGWAVWLNRAFALSWILFLFNLIPAYPLDGGRLLQSMVWARADYRRGVTVAAYSGFVFAVIFLIVSIAVNEAVFMGLALFMLYESSMALYRLEMEDGPFGYDFSGGYTTLEKDEEPPPKPKRVGWFTRWRQARRARKLAREAEERARDDERMDQLLEKIARSGKDSLTEEEKRFLERMSARKRNMS